MAVTRVPGAGAAQPDIRIVSGFVDIDVSLGDKDLNVLAVPGIREIDAMWAWISQNGQTLGANTEQALKLLFFATDAFEHAVQNADPDTDGLVAEFPEFQHVVQDVKANFNNGATSFTIDSNDLYSAGLLVRIFDDTVEEFQRIKGLTSTDQLDLEDAIKKSGSPAFVVDDDVAVVQEIGRFPYEDKDDSGEIHLRISPGDTAGDDVRFNFVIQYRAHEGS